MPVNYYNDDVAMSRSTRTQQIKFDDSALLILVFIIGLSGLVYIMHQAVSKRQDTTSYSQPVGDPNANDESIYLTATSR